MLQRTLQLFSVPTMFVTLSLIIVLGLPLRAIYRLIALRQLSVFNLGTISICCRFLMQLFVFNIGSMYAVTIRHVKRQLAFRLFTQFSNWKAKVDVGPKW